MECELPADALLQRYAAQPGAYTDSWALALPRPVTHAAMVEAFYTSWLFRVERLILAVLARKPSSDAEAARLARGQADGFAAWRVEARAADQILLCDFLGRTRSWLMTRPVADGTRLHFGSAVVPPPGGRDIGRGYRALLGLHRLYSRLLLRACAGRLRRRMGGWN